MADLKSDLLSDIEVTQTMFAPEQIKYELTDNSVKIDFSVEPKFLADLIELRLPYRKKLIRMFPLFESASEDDVLTYKTELLPDFHCQIIVNFHSDEIVEISSINIPWLPDELVEKVLQRLSTHVKETIKCRSDLSIWELCDYIQTNLLVDCQLIKRSKTGPQLGMDLSEDMYQWSLTSVAIFCDALKEKINQQFAKSYFECEVCLEQVKGANGLRFIRCGHKFCRDCIECYVNSLLQMPRNLVCLACDEEFALLELKKVLGREKIQMLDKMLLDKFLLESGSLIYCPRNCPTPATKYENEEDLAICQDCSFAFCYKCKEVFHSGFSCMVNPYTKKKIVATADNRDELIKLFGLRTIEKLEEEEASYAYLIEARACPNCGVKVEKIDGCNKMICIRCRIPFCWKCLTVINVSNPYSHFNSGTAVCRLFGGDGEDPENEDFW